MARSGKAHLTIAIGGEYTGRAAVRRAEKELRALRDAAREAGSGAEDIMSIGDSMVDLGSAFEVSGQKVSDFGTKLTKVTAPLAAIGVASVKLAADYEDSVAKVYTIMDKHAMSTGQMSKNILDLSTATGKSATELADASYQALSASVETSKVGGFVERSAKLAKAGFTETATSVDTLTTIVNAYGYSADDAAMISDKLVQTQNKGKTTVDELASSIGSIIPTASAYNVSLDNLLSGYVLLTKQGIDTANATTALNGMFTELADSGSQVAQVLQSSTGKTFGQLMSDGQTLGSVIQALSDSVGGNSEAFANLWGNVRAAKGALAIANAGASEFDAAMKDMASSAGLVDSALEDLATPAAKARNAFNALKNTGIELGEELLGAATPAIDDLARKAQGLYKWFGSLDEGTKQTIVTFGTLAVVSGPVVTLLGKGVTALGGFVSGVGRGVQSIGTFTAAMKAAEVEMKAAGATSVSLGAKMKAAATATGLAAKAATLLKGSLAMLGVSLLVTLVGHAVDAFAKMQEHTASLDKATRGLESSMDSVRTAADGYASSIDKATDAMDGHKQSIDDVIADQAEFADKLSDAYAEVGRDSAMLQDYTRVIQELGGKGKLTADEQTRLTEAVRAFSQITGQNVSVVNAETGALDTSKQAIMDTASAYRDRATAAVSQENIVAIDKQVKTLEEELKRATEEKSAADAANQQLMLQYPEIAYAYANSTTAASQKVQELTRMLESARAQQKQMYDSITKVGAGALATADSAETLGASMDSAAASTANMEAASKALQKQLDAQYKAQQKAYDQAYKAQQKALQAEEKALQKSHQNRLKEVQKSLDAQYEAVQKRLDKRYDALKKALDKEEDAMKASHDRRLDKLKASQQAEVDAFDAATDKRIAIMEREYNASVQHLEASRDARVKAIDDQIAAIEAEDAAAEKAALDAEREQKKAELQKAVNSAKSATARQRAEKELSDYLAKIAAEDAKEQRRQTIDRLTESKQAIKDETAAAKDAVKERYDATREAYEQRRAAEKEALVADHAEDYEMLKAKLAAEETALAESHDRRLEKQKEADAAQLEALKEAQDAKLEALREKLQEQEEALRESHQESLEAMREAQQDQLSALRESQQEQLDAIRSSGAAMAQTAGESAEKAGDNVRQGLESKKEDVDTVLANARAAGLRFFGATEEDARKGGEGTAEKFAEGMESKEPGVLSKGAGVVATATDAMERASTDISLVGVNFVQGFGDGMSTVDIWGAAYSIGVTALDAIKSALGIASPSKEAKWVGEMYGEGIAIGMGSTEKAIAAESRKLTDAMTLEPTPYGTYALPSQAPGQYGRRAGEAMRQIVVNMTLNVTARDVQEAIAIGKGAGEALYEEFARRERQL